MSCIWDTWLTPTLVFMVNADHICHETQLIKFSECGAGQRHTELWTRRPTVPFIRTIIHTIWAYLTRSTTVCSLRKLLHFSNSPQAGGYLTLLLAGAVAMAARQRASAQAAGRAQQGSPSSGWSVWSAAAGCKWPTRKSTINQHILGNEVEWGRGYYVDYFVSNTERVKEGWRFNHFVFHCCNVPPC